MDCAVKNYVVNVNPQLYVLPDVLQAFVRAGLRQHDADDDAEDWVPIHSSLEKAAIYF